MKYFTKAQMDKLAKYEVHFRSIVISLCKQHTNARDNDVVADVWDEYTGSKTARNWGCGSCVYNLFKKVGEVYFYTQNNKPKNIGRPKKS